MTIPQTFHLPLYKLPHGFIENLSWARDVAQLVECLLCVSEALGLTPALQKQKQILKTLTIKISKLFLESICVPTGEGGCVDIC